MAVKIHISPKNRPKIKFTRNMIGAFVVNCRFDFLARIVTATAIMERYGVATVVMLLLPDIAITVPKL